MQQTASQPTKGKDITGFFLNPLIRKLGKIEEVSDDCATYNGIARKCGMFLASIFIGVAIAMILQAINPIDIDMDGNIVSVSPAATVVCIFSLALFIITPFLAFFIRSTIPVTGTLYCACTGYVFTFLSLVLEEYRGPVLLALFITVVIVAVMALIYAKGWIKVDQKFRTVFTILFWTTVASSLLVGVCYFIPALKCVPDFIKANPILSIGGALLYVVIASLFLLIDFDTIQKAVERKLPKKYEWYAAFGLAFSVIWLFLKVFDLISRFNNSNSSNS